MAGDIPVKPRQFRPRPAAAKGMDHKRQRNLVEPGVERLHDQFPRAVFRDIAGVVREPRTKRLRALEKEPTRVEVKIALPVFIGLVGIEAACEIEPETIIERFPDLVVSGPVKPRFRPGVLPFHRRRGAREIEPDRGQPAGKERVGIDKQKRFVRQGGQAFDLVAIGVGFAKDLIVEWQDVSPEPGKKVKDVGVFDGRVRLPERAGPGLGDEQTALKVRVGGTQAGGKQNRLIGQSPRLPDGDDVEPLPYRCCACHSDPALLFQPVVATL